MAERSGGDSDRPKLVPADQDRADQNGASHERADNHAADDRRRSRRFTCGGEAKISRLPSDGIFVPGKILDLSLGGCRVDANLPARCGWRAEIMVRVNAASFRAVGEVRAIRGGSGTGIEFVQLSTGGKDMLAELVAELARLQAIMNQLRSARRGTHTESFRRQIEDGRLGAVRLSERFPFLGTILRGEEPEPKSRQSASDGKDRIAETQPLVIAVDLFG
jgi:hypothetical protein